MRHKFHWVLLFVIQIIGISFQARAEKDEILCERAPTAYVVGEVKSNGNVRNPCNASAKIQAIAYECGDALDTFRITQVYFKQNLKRARAKCQEFCESISPMCKAKFVEPSACGFTIPSARAIETGRLAGCPAHCKGQAFNYCSLYHANFFSTDPTLFKDKPANCYCNKK